MDQLVHPERGRQSKLHKQHRECQTLAREYASRSILLWEHPTMELLARPERGR